MTLQYGSNMFAVTYLPSSCTFFKSTSAPKLFAQLNVGVSIDIRLQICVLNHSVCAHILLLCVNTVCVFIYSNVWVQEEE